MAHMIPPDYPLGTSPGEVLIFEQLRDASIGRDWTVLHSLHLPEHVRQIEGEADFVILMPQLGVLCLEVKSHLRADYVNGAWYLGEDASPDCRGPFRQAEMAARSVKKKVSSALPPARSILFWPCVAFTHCIPASRAAAGEWHSWQLLTRADLERERIDHLLEAVMRRAREFVTTVEQATWFDPSSSRPNKSDCDTIRRVLRPDVHLLPATNAERDRRASEIRRFTEEQLQIIEGLDGVNDRALIEGPAGTGKTVLAFEEARRANSSGQRTALLCFNRQLAASLRLEARSLGIEAVDITTMHSLLRRFATDNASDLNAADPAYWSRTLPDLALARLLEDGPRYDFLIIDEAQDLAEPAYLDVMDALLVGELAAGTWRMFGDFEKQAIFATAPLDTIARIAARSPSIARYKLTRNCRNTPRVAEYIMLLGGLRPGYTRILRPDCGPEGTPRTLFYRNRDEQIDLLRATIKEIHTTGEFAAEDIVVLSPIVDSCAKALSICDDTPSLVELPEQRKGASSYGTIASFKGLEAPAVVLTDMDEVATDRAQRLFYVAVSRATDRLRVLIRDGLQDDVAHLMQGALRE